MDQTPTEIMRDLARTRECVRAQLAELVRLAYTEGHLAGSRSHGTPHERAEDWQRSDARRATGEMER